MMHIIIIYYQSYIRFNFYKNIFDYFVFYTLLSALFTVKDGLETKETCQNGQCSRVTNITYY